MAVDKEAVRWAYRLFLGREPESETALSGHAGAASLEVLARNFIKSDEFNQRAAAFGVVEAGRPTNPPVGLPCLDIEYEVDATTRDAILEHVRSTWEWLGATRPFHSVLTRPGFLPANLPANENEFWSSGEREAQAAVQAFRRFGVSDLSGATLVELGCGLGRVTIPLARAAGTVIGYDISRPHLAIAHSRAQSTGIRNIRFVQLETFSDFRLEFDAFYSRIVLQHNPPPLIKMFVEKICDLLKPGGVAIFQFPIYLRGYRFKASTYLASRSSQLDMEMHVLPQDAVFTAIDRAACKLLEVRETEDTGRPDVFLSNTFIVGRP